MILAAVSIAFYTIQIILFHDSRNTFFYLLQDCAFMPLQVLIVTLVLDQILSIREKNEKLRKLNVVISAYFSEIGNSALKAMKGFCRNDSIFKNELDVKTDWNDNDFKKAVKLIEQANFDVDSRIGDIISLKNILLDKKHFMLGLFENSNLIEHDQFTDMLWAVFHIEDELEHRRDFNSLPEADLDHLSTDIERALRLLAIEWIYNMNHLKREYPYLFSLAVRKSPFSDNNDVSIKI